MQKVLPGSHQSSINIYKFTVVIQLLRKSIQYYYVDRLYTCWKSIATKSITHMSRHQSWQLIPDSLRQDIKTFHYKKMFIRITRRVRTIRIVTATEIHDLRTFRATAGRNLVLLLDVPSLAKTCTELPPSLSLPATSGRAARAASERGVVVRRRFIKMTNVWSHCFFLLIFRYLNRTQTL